MFKTTLTHIRVIIAMLGAIQGLNQKLADELKAKSAEIAQLKARLAAIERRLGVK